MRLVTLLLLIFACCVSIQAQRIPDHIYMPDIHSVKLFPQNNQSAPALLILHSSDLLELHFDDLGGSPKNYYYTYQLCNADWTPADVNVFDYIKGFLQNRLNQYRISSVAATKYVHYQALLPEHNAIPIKSGNYLLKVFLDADTSKLAFTKRLLIVDNKVQIGAKVQQPFDPALGNTHQKVQFSVNTQQLNILSPQMVKAVVLQNSRWDNAVTDIQPSFIRGNSMEYNGEQDCVFPAGKEYRWADLQSFRFQSERIERVDQMAQPVKVFLKPDPERSRLRYLFFKDRNGWEEIGTTEYTNPWWQSDYANVTFTYTPVNNQPYPGKTIYLVGEMTANEIGAGSKLVYDAERGVYTTTLLLKQGYYSYMYVTKDDRNKTLKADPALTEGNYRETENDYTVLFYYRSFSSRYDELIGISTVSSRNLDRGF